MATLNFFILTQAERDVAVTYSRPTAGIDPRPIDAPYPGVGINLNGSATNYAAGDAVDLVAKYVAPVRIITDVTYPQDMKDYLLTLPCAILDGDTVFLPPEL